MQDIDSKPEVATGHDKLAAVDKNEFGRMHDVSKRTVDGWIHDGCPHLKISPRMVRLPLPEASDWVRNRFLQRRVA
jgi:hypothetical protein